MKNSKVLQFLGALSVKELARFEKFILSPHFNTHQETVKFFYELKKHYPDFPEERVKKDKIYSSLFGKGELKEEKLYTLSKYLVKLLLDFLTEEEIQEDIWGQKKLATLRALYNKNLHKQIPKVLNDYRKELENLPEKGAPYYFQRFNLEDFSTEFQLAQENRSHTISYFETAVELDTFYLLLKLQYACALIDQGKSVALDREIPMLCEILSYCRKNESSLNPAIRLYFQLALLLSHPQDEESFHTLKSLILSKEAALSLLEQKNFFTHLLNYCSHQYKQGKKSYLQEMFSLYQEMIARNLIFDSTLTSSMYFKNVVHLGLKLEKQDWVGNFIQEYRHKLDDISGSGVVEYCLADLNFSLGEYQKTFRHLQKVTFVDPFFRLNHDLLLMKTYYECEEEEGFYSLYNKFQVYLSRNKSMSPESREANKNAANIVKKLFSKQAGSSKGLSKLLMEVENSKYLVERNWIEEKIKLAIQKQEIKP